MITTPSETAKITGEIMGTPQQIALLNNMLPAGFRFEYYDRIQKSKNCYKLKHKQPVICL
jgi:hypothetical protein